MSQNVRKCAQSDKAFGVLDRRQPQTTTTPKYKALVKAYLEVCWLGRLIPDRVWRQVPAVWALKLKPGASEALLSSVNGIRPAVAPPAFRSAALKASRPSATRLSNPVRQTKHWPKKQRPGRFSRPARLHSHRAAGKGLTQRRPPGLHKPPTRVTHGGGQAQTPSPGCPNVSLAYHNWVPGLSFHHVFPQSPKRYSGVRLGGPGAADYRR